MSFGVGDIVRNYQAKIHLRHKYLTRDHQTRETYGLKFSLTLCPLYFDKLYPGYLKDLESSKTHVFNVVRWYSLGWNLDKQYINMISYVT